MHSALTRVGAVVSIIWIVVIAYLACRDMVALNQMTPNEWGDFFAGSFAPLAFLWLVLGFLQQGEELRLSTDALRLQAEELKNSVQQQRELVEVSRQQVESEREALAFERQLREDISKPKFSVSGDGGSFRGDGHSSYAVSIHNAGHDATDFLAKIQLMGGPWKKLIFQPLFSKGGSYTARIEHHVPLADGNSFLVLTFTDGLGRTIEEKYRIVQKSQDNQAGIMFLHNDT